MIQHQRGMTIWGWLFVLGTLGFFAMIGMKLAPVYVENMSVKKAVSQVAGQSVSKGLSRKSAWDGIAKQFYVDDVRSVTEDDVSIEDNEGVKELVVTYEVRKNVMFNVDMVVWFEERAPIRE